MGYEVEPEDGEMFTLIGEAEVAIRGIGSQLRKGNLVVTDRRVAFKGRLAFKTPYHLIAHAAGFGEVDFSIAYEDIRGVREGNPLLGWHLELDFYNREKGCDQILGIKLHRWGKAADAADGMEKACIAADVAGNLPSNMSFVPIVGDFLAIGIKAGHWLEGKSASKEWKETIDAIKVQRAHDAFHLRSQSAAAVQAKEKVAEVAPATISEPPAETEEPPAAKKSKGKKKKEEPEEKLTCRHCQKELDPEWTACPFCASDLEAPCPKCGKASQPSWTCCPYCKTNLDIPVDRTSERTVSKGKEEKREIPHVQASKVGPEERKEKKEEKVDRCPKCGRVQKKRWLICPYCDEN